MAVKVKLNSAGVNDVFAQWARNDGATRAERVAAQQRATAPVESGELRDSIEVQRHEHPTRPAFHIGPTAAHGLAVEARTGFVSRSLDAAG